MEIERKFLLKYRPQGLDACPRQRLEQAYLSTEPVVRVRRAGEEYWLTVKGQGLLSREEFELPLSPAAYAHLKAKADGAVIEKDRWRVPLGERTAEVDLFAGAFAPLAYVEVEFPAEAAAAAFVPPDWFGREVTYDKDYTNAALSRRGCPPPGFEG